MPDISMCMGYDNASGIECPMREACYRYLASPCEYRQSYLLDAPFIIEPDGISCEYFWKEDK